MTAFVQTVTAFLAGVFYYMAAVLIMPYDGILTLILQPVMAALFTLFSMLLLAFVGLPIRIYRPLNSWWRAHWWVPFLIGTFAFGLMALSNLPYFQIIGTNPELGTPQQLPNPIMAGSGWLLTIFAALHFYPPIMRRMLRPATAENHSLS